MVIICKWPVLIRDYPDQQELHSWSSIFEFCRDELAVHCKLHGRKKGSVLPGELVLKGSNVNEAFKHVSGRIEEGMHQFVEGADGCANPGGRP